MIRETNIILLFLSTIFISALLIGCVSYQSQPLSATSTAVAFNNRSLDDPALGRFIQQNHHTLHQTWPLQSWDLTSLTFAALYYHPDLAVARTNNEIAQAAAITAGMRPNPSLAFSPEFITHMDQGLAPWNIAGIVNFPIETAGKRGYRMTQAQHLSQAAQLQTIHVAWQVRNRVRASLLALYGAEQKENLWRKQQQVQTDIVNLMRQRLTTGAISSPEFNQAEIALQQTTLALNEASKQRAIALAQLASSVGVTEIALTGKTIIFSDVSVAPTPQALPLRLAQQRALTTRPDILAALQEYAASQSALQLEIAKQYPDVILGPGYTWNQGQNQWMLGLALDLPLLNHNEGPIAEAKARRANAAARFLALQASLVGAIEQAMADYKGSYHKLQVVNASMSTQKQAYEAAATSFKIGETDRLAFLNSQLTYTTAQQLQIDTMIQTQQALGNLEDGLQYPLGPKNSEH